jgi:prolyl-tRNA editing enzyme YbaK/EbsC (Cys-tRNA(Pro) deacylase)
MSDTPPKSSIDRVAADAVRLGLAIEIKRLDQSTRTAEEAAQACGCDVGQIVKSLIFQEEPGGRLVLLLVSGRHNVDLDHMATEHGLRLQRADARRVRDETGFAIGGVAPIGHLAPIDVFMDDALLGYERVWAAAGRPDSVFAVEPHALRAAIHAHVLSMAGADRARA